jgi:hypothetical protein
MELLVINPDAAERATIEAVRRLAGPVTLANLAAEEARYTAG